MATWSAAKEAGFALAALLCDDRALAHSAPALPAEVAARARARLLPSDSTRAPAGLIAELLTEVRPPLTSWPRGLPPRLGALLASKLPRPLARELVAAAPHARGDYAPPADLLPLLFRIARSARATDARGGPREQNAPDAHVIQNARERDRHGSER